MKIGIIGGGQLALMMIQSQPQHTYYVLEPKQNCSVKNVAKVFHAPYDNVDALKNLASHTDIITYEFENIPFEKLNIIKKKLFPSSEILKISQNRFSEKTFAKENGLNVPLFFKINNLRDLESILKNNKNNQWVLKTNTGGYDGKGQILIRKNQINQEVVEMVSKCECILEEWIKFEYETSLIMSRNLNGEVVYLPPTMNIHHNNILSITNNIPSIDFIDDMALHCKKIMESFQMVGTLAIEFFITKNGPIFNEMAPRPHNSGHWSIEGTNASQFLNHINAITNKLLIKPIQKGYTVMINLLGEQYTKAKNIISFDDHVVLHDYFKDEIKQNRKMGHITISYTNKEKVKDTLDKIIKGLN